MKTEEQIDNETEKIVVDIQQSVWQNTRKSKRRTVGINYPREIKALVEEKRIARRIWQQTRAST